MSYETFIFIMIFITGYPYIILAALTFCLASILCVSWLCFKKVFASIVHGRPAKTILKKERDDYKTVMIGTYKMIYTSPEGNVNKYNELKGTNTK